MYARIVVPLDGSDLAEVALNTAIELAPLMNAGLLLIRVVAQPAATTGGILGWDMQQAALAQLVEQDIADSHTYLEGVRERLLDRVPNVETSVRRGMVMQSILHDSRDGDLIVMGTHGRGGISRWFYGSVAEDVLRHATVPVLLIRTGGKAVS